MLTRIRTGQTFLEYVILIIIVFGIFLSFQKYLIRGVSGRLKVTGDGLAQGRLYDPHTTVECHYDFEHTNQWYDAKCYDEHCWKQCLTIQKFKHQCPTCINSCRSSFCADLDPP